MTDYDSKTTRCSTDYGLRQQITRKLPGRHEASWEAPTCRGARLENGTSAAIAPLRAVLPIGHLSALQNLSQSDPSADLTASCSCWGSNMESAASEQAQIILAPQRYRWPQLPYPSSGTYCSAPTNRMANEVWPNWVSCYITLRHRARHKIAE